MLHKSFLILSDRIPYGLVLKLVILEGILVVKFVEPRNSETPRPIPEALIQAFLVVFRVIYRNTMVYFWY